MVHSKFRAILFSALLLSGCAAVSGPATGPGAQATGFTQKIAGTWKCIQPSYEAGDLLIIGPTTIDYLGRGSSAASLRLHDGTLSALDSGQLYHEQDNLTGMPCYMAQLGSSAFTGYYRVVRIDSSSSVMQLLGHDSLMASSSTSPQRYPSWLFVRIADQPLKSPVEVDTARFHSFTGRWQCIDSVIEAVWTGWDSTSYWNSAGHWDVVHAHAGGVRWGYGYTLDAPDTVPCPEGQDSVTMFVRGNAFRGTLSLSSSQDSVYQQNDTNFHLHLV